MIISLIASKLNISVFKSSREKVALKKRRKSLERAYGKAHLTCRSRDEMAQWHLREDPYMAELFAE